MAKIDSTRIRENSVDIAKGLGFYVLPTLPLLEPELRVRDTTEVVQRMLALHVLAATAYGLPRERAVAFVEREGLREALTSRELRFIFDRIGVPYCFQVQVEGLWALGWAMGIVDAIGFGQECRDDFVELFPDLTQEEPTTAEFRSEICPRSDEEVVGACDTAYCLHWAIRQSSLTGAPIVPPSKEYVITERRRALEWLLSDLEWDQVELDT